MVNKPFQIHSHYHHVKLHTFINRLVQPWLNFRMCEREMNHCFMIAIAIAIAIIIVIVIISGLELILPILMKVKRNPVSS